MPCLKIKNKNVDIPRPEGCPKDLHRRWTLQGIHHSLSVRVREGGEGGSKGVNSEGDHIIEGPRERSPTYLGRRP